MVTEAVGAAGTAGTASTVSGVAADTQVLSVALRAVTLCAPGATPANVGDTWNVPPSRLYSNPAKNGAVMTMVQGVDVKGGLMRTEAVGAAGTAGTASTVSGVAADTQVLSVALRAVTLCARGATWANVVDSCNVPPSRLYSNPAPTGAVMTMVPVGIAQVG